MPSPDFSMKVKFYGTRGSIPVCSRDFQDFGGNTTCIGISIPDPDILSIIDAGTGIRVLGKELVEERDTLPKEITIGFSHFHWDHIQGFPFFSPAYFEDTQMNILMMGKHWTRDQLKEILMAQMGGNFFPIDFTQMGAHFNFVAIGGKVVQRSSRISVEARLHEHPGGAYGFRLERNGKVVVIVTDIEHSNGIDPGTVALAKNADVLIHEAQYTNQQLNERKGWGHSSFDQAMLVAEMAEARQLIMTHHDPDHNDAFLTQMEKRCQKRFKDCVLAREGMEVVI